MPSTPRIWSRLIGHLRDDERGPKLDQLQELLPRVLLPEDPQQLKGTDFSFEAADIFSLESVGLDRNATIERLSQSAAGEDFRLFVREVPLRSTQLHGSNPHWASGALAERTVGPFVDADGRSVWFDFFRIEKLVALYVQGVSEPALLFKIRSGFSFIDALRPLAAEAATTYRLVAGSIWINSRLLAADAPAGYFTGLTIRSGIITLNAEPAVVNGRLTIKPATRVRVHLHLQSPAAAEADAASPFGDDAEAAQIDLPTEFAFTFAGTSRALEMISRASWSVYGHEAVFEWRQQQTTTYEPLLNRVLIPLTASTETFEVRNNRSPFHTLRGQATITGSFWALPSAAIDVANPLAAEGIGALAVRGAKGLTSTWTALQGGSVALSQPYVMASPGRVAVSDAGAGNVLCHQDFNLWQDAINPHGTTAHVQFIASAPFVFNSIASGVEAVSIRGNAEVRADRPVTARGEPISIRSKDTLLMLVATSSQRFVQFFDDDMLVDDIDPAIRPAERPKSLSLVLSNALFKTTPVQGCVLFGRLAEDFIRVEQASLFLTLGLQAYLPTLPDPYAANINQLKYQFRQPPERGSFGVSQPHVWLLLVCRVKWEPVAEPGDKVEVSFHFAPLPGQPAWSEPAEVKDLNFVAMVGGDTGAGTVAQAQSGPAFSRLKRSAPDYGAIWNEALSFLPRDQFSLLDVSTNADLLGVSFSTFATGRMAMLTTMVPAQGGGFPLQVKGLEVVSRGMNVRAFTVPQISWEPVINLTPPPDPSVPPNPVDPSPASINDPPFGPNYYPDDGGPTRLLNNSADHVALAPIPLTDFLVESFAEKPNFSALSLFTLPFGMRALALLQARYVFGSDSRPGANLHFNAKTWASGVSGARQLQVDGGQALEEGESDMFMGSTVQENNILNLTGAKTSTSTLGENVTDIFNKEFLLQPFQIIRQRGVPLSRMDLSGYGASIFSNWINPKAAIAETSQAKFDVFVGRCAHEIIQVKSIVYPYGIKVVRTITLLRANSAYCYRFDTGWRAESDGRFDFTYYVDTPEPKARDPGYPIHPGIVHGVFNISNIREIPEIAPFQGSMVFPAGQKIVNGNGQEIPNDGRAFPYDLQPLYFDADVEIENPVSGYVTKKIGGKERRLVPSKRILGFVQIAPRGIPLSVERFKALLARQGESIGGPIDCVVDIGKSGQQMRLSRFDLANSFDASGSGPAFAATGRGSVLLPKDGSWSLVKHEYATGQVSPVPAELSAPLIRIGALIKGPGDALAVVPAPESQLLRIANPTELLRTPVSGTINYGFLQTTETQKALFLTPAFQQDVATLLSKTPPLFADAFRLVSSKAIFPNIGNAVTGFGDVISLGPKGTEFADSGLTDAGATVRRLMAIHDGAGAAKKEGYKLLKAAAEGFDLPTKEWELINLTGALRIYLDYKAQKKGQPGPDLGKLDFDVDSFTEIVADQWKSRMNNVAVVVDLGPIKRLMTIKGNWNSQKGSSAQYAGNPSDPAFPSPQIEFAKELQPAIEILQILEDLQGLNYKEAFQRGLKLAMSNKAGSWEYRFDATKEIPVLKFPMAPFDNDPNAPLKLEAGLRIGVYFNSAVSNTGDPKDLLPSAGASLGFYGRLSVMCVSLSVATVYAVGQVTLDIAADSRVGPSLRMKFGFGAQIVIGLPVVGNVSVLYMVGVEMYTDSTQLHVSAFLLFQGHAELLAGLISVTITIEAKGTVKRLNDRTDLEAQVTFGLDISIFLVINISFSTSWSEARQIA